MGRDDTEDVLITSTRPRHLTGEPKMSWLQSHELVRLASMRRPEDRRRFVSGHTMVRSVLSDLLAIPPGEVRLDQTCRSCGAQHGGIRVLDSSVRVSLTYASDLAVAAFSPRSAIGIDVARIGSVGEDHRRLWRSALSPPERDHLASRPITEDDRDFLTYWVRKEALTKCTSVGLAADLTDITVTGPEEDFELLRWCGRTAADTFVLRDVRIEGRDHVGALAVQSERTGGLRPWGPVTARSAIVSVAW